MQITCLCDDPSHHSTPFYITGPPLKHCPQSSIHITTLHFASQPTLYITVLHLYITAPLLYQCLHSHSLITAQPQHQCPQSSLHITVPPFHHSPPLHHNSPFTSGSLLASSHWPPLYISVLIFSFTSQPNPLHHSLPTYISVLSPHITTPLSITGLPSFTDLPYTAGQRAGGAADLDRVGSCPT